MPFPGTERKWTGTHALFYLPLPLCSPPPAPELELELGLQELPSHALFALNAYQ